MPPTKCPICRFVNDDDQAVCRRCGTPISESSGGRKRPAGERRAERGAQPSLNIRRGQVIAKRYVVQSIVGRGGMGCIYKVHDNTLDEDVALKTLLPEYSRDKMVVERFFNEARIARGLSHPNVVRVHDIGIEGDVVYISMEFLPGNSLRSMLEALPPGQRLPVRTVLEIFDGLCAALEYAHQYTVHRDIKPENVMVLPDGTVKLMDFGISKLMGNSNVTSASIVMGTPFYMSPEQVKHSANVDARADIYSVGVMLYEVLSGHAPTGIRKALPADSSEVPPALDPIIEKCVDPDPEKRYSSAGALRTALANVAKPTTSTAFERILPVQPIEARSGGSYLRTAVGVVLLCLVWGVAGLGLWRSERQRLRLVDEAKAVHVNPWDAIARNEAAPHERFIVMSQLFDRARQKAGAELLRYDDGSQREAAQSLMNDADGWRASAEALADADAAGALEMGWNALYRYTALILRVDGMLFVPSGSNEAGEEAAADETARLGGFLIDERPVTAREFALFARENDWRSTPEILGASAAPVVNVTYYDAVAYAAARAPAARIPTDAQWQAAVREADSESILNMPEASDDEAVAEPDDEPGAVNSGYAVYPGLREWTRDSAAGFGGSLVGNAVPTFRSSMTTQQLRTDESMKFAPERGTALYETRSPYVGFRCVIELPDTLDELAAFLQ